MMANSTQCHLTMSSKAKHLISRQANPSTSPKQLPLNNSRLREGPWVDYLNLIFDFYSPRQLDSLLINALNS
jgi:hypothetical protein